MPTFNKPALLPIWCREDQTNVAQPPDSLRDAGYTGNEVPMAEHINWLYQQYGQWLGYLDQANAVTVMAATRESNMRLIGGGNWSFNAASSTLAWDAPASLSIPGCPIADNTFPAGSAVLGMNQVAFVSANVPYTTNGGLTSGSVNVTGIELTSAISVGQTIAGAGVPANTTVLEIGDGTLKMSQPATVTAAAASLTFVGSSALSVQSADAATLTPSSNTIVIALGLELSAIVGVGSGQMAVLGGESKRLLQAGYVSTLRMPAGVDLAANTPVYVAAAADGRSTGSFYPCEAGNKNGAARGQFVGFTYAGATASTTARVVTSGVLRGFTGLAIGSVYYLDPAVVGGITNTKPVSAGSYVVPVGYALTNDALKLNPASTHALLALSDDYRVAGNFSVAGLSQFNGVTGPLNVDGSVTSTSLISGARVASGTGFAQQVDMGALYVAGNQSFPTTPGVGQNIYSPTPLLKSYGVLGANNANNGQRIWAPGKAGSILNVQFWFSANPGADLSVYVRLLRANAAETGFGFTVTATAAGDQFVASYLLSKGQRTFAAGDAVAVSASLPNKRAADMIIQCDMTVEMAA